MAQILRRESGNGGMVVVWKMEESLDQLFAMLHLRKEDRDRVDSYRLESRKQEFLTARCLIKEVLGEEPIVDYLESGKPVLKNADYKISISHTKGYVAVVFSKGAFAGVDIEYPSQRVARVFKRFVSDNEAAFIPEESRIEYYTMMWCLKESMYKMYDRKNSIFNMHFICHPFKLQSEGRISATFNFEDCRTLDFAYVTTQDFYLVYHC